MVVGLHHVRLLQASSSTQFAVTPQQLAEAVAADLQRGLIPFYYLATIGALSRLKVINSASMPAYAVNFLAGVSSPC